MKSEKNASVACCSLARVCLDYLMKLSIHFELTNKFKLIRAHDIPHYVKPHYEYNGVLLCKLVQRMSIFKIHSFLLVA